MLESPMILFRAGLEQLMSECRDREYARDPGRDRTVAYGNVRSHEWTGETRTSVALIYETPGGSTDQISVEFDPDTQTFTLPAPEEGGEISTSDPDEALTHMRRHLDAIPAKRMERLRSYIRAWCRDEGRSRVEIFNELNRLQKEESRGGRITHEELAIAIRYAVELDKETRGKNESQ